MVDEQLKEDFARETNLRTLGDAIKGADIFIGVSAKDVLTPEMLKSMNRDPIVFAMANPDPEIDYNLAVQTRSDIIMATGRSDFGMLAVSGCIRVPSPAARINAFIPGPPSQSPLPC